MTPDRRSISVVIPTHNRRDTVVLAVESALAQSRPPDEVIVIADGCTDGTAEAVEAIGDERVWPLEVEKGAGFGYAHRATAVARAKGEVVSYLADDDLYMPDHLERISELFDARIADIVQATSTVIRVDGVLDGTCGDWGVPFYLERLMSNDNRAPMSSVSHTVEAAMAVGGWRAEVRRGGDTDLWQRMLRDGARPGMVATPTVLNFQAAGRTQAWDERIAQNADYLGRLGDPVRLAELRREMSRAAYKRMGAEEDQGFHRGREVDVLRRELEPLRLEAEHLRHTLHSTLNGRWWRLRRALEPAARAVKAGERALGLSRR